MKKSLIYLAALTTQPILLAVSLLSPFAIADESWKITPQNIWATKFTVQSEKQIGVAKLTFNTFQFTRQNVLSSFDESGNLVGKTSWRSPGKIEFEDIQENKKYFIDAIKVKNDQDQFEDKYVLSDSDGIELGTIEGGKNQYFSPELGMKLTWQDKTWTYEFENPTPYAKLFTSFAAFQSRLAVSNGFYVAKVAAATAVLLGVAVKIEHDGGLKAKHGGGGMNKNNSFDETNYQRFKDAVTQAGKMDPASVIRSTKAHKTTVENFVNQINLGNGPKSTAPFFFTLPLYDENGFFNNQYQSFYQNKNWYFQALARIAHECVPDDTHEKNKLEKVLKTLAADTKLSGAERLEDLLKVKEALSKSADDESPAIVDFGKGESFTLRKKPLSAAYRAAVKEFEKSEQADAHHLKLLQIAEAGSGKDAIALFKTNVSSASRAEIIDYKKVLSARVKCSQYFDDLAPSTDGSLAKRYRTLSLMFHPDKPLGDSEIFTHINGLYEAAKTAAEKQK